MALDKHLNELQNALDKGVVKAMELYVRDEAGYVRNPWLTKGTKLWGKSAHMSHFTGLILFTKVP